MCSREATRSLDRLTSLRAIAALGVLAYHCGYNLHLTVARQVFSDGYAGVGFFFVLSGFVLTWVARPAESATRFYRRRFARIYPSYLVASMVTLVIVGGASFTVVGANLFLIQPWFALSLPTSHLVVFGLNPPSWSLGCEASFYLAFPLLIRASMRVSTQRFVMAGISWALLCAAGALALAHLGPRGTGVEVAYFLPVVRSGEFVLGSALCVAVRSGWRPSWRLWHAAVALVVSDAISRALGAPLPDADVALVTAFAAVIAAAAAADAAGETGWLTRRALVYAGEVSFAFYIIQYPVLVVAERHGGGPISASLLAAVGTTVAAVTLHHVVERPFQRLLVGHGSLGRLQRQPVGA